MDEKREFIEACVGHGIGGAEDAADALVTIARESPKDAHGIVVSVLGSQGSPLYYPALSLVRAVRRVPRNLKTEG